MEGKWWENSAEDSHNTTPPRTEDRQTPFKYKAEGNPLMLLGWVVGLSWLSLSLAGTTSDFAEEIVFPEEHDVTDYYGGECIWEGGMDEDGVYGDRWYCRYDGAPPGYWDSDWYYCENQWDDNWFCTNDFGQDSEYEFSADMERLVDYRMRNLFYYAFSVLLFMTLFPLFTLLLVGRDKNWSSIEVQGQTVILRRWYIPLKIKTVTYKEIDASEISEVQADMVWVDTTSSDDHQGGV